MATTTRNLLLLAAALVAGGLLLWTMLLSSSRTWVIFGVWALFSIGVVIRVRHLARQDPDDPETGQIPLDDRL